jgi:spermidine synthase/MFS family permease
MYEVSWNRTIYNLLGCTTYSVTAVLIAFMGGLALGSFIAGRFAARVKNPLRVYGFLEISVGLAAVLATILMAASRPLLKIVYDPLEGHATAFFVFKFTLSVAVFAVPTTLMGATLPVLAHLFVRGRDSVVSGVGNLYGINTLGAFAGTALAGFLLLGTIGTSATIAAAVLTNLAVGVAAVALSRRLKPAPAEPQAGDASPVPAGPAASPALRPDAPPPPQPAAAPEANADSGEPPSHGIKFSFPRRKKGSNPLPVRVPIPFIYIAFALSGFAAMTYQVAWTRVFELYIGSSTYAFTIILLAFLAGIGLGSVIIARLPGRFAGGVFVFVALELIIALAGGLAIPAAGETLPLVLIRIISNNKDSFTTLIAAELAVVFFALLIPTLAMGALFPAVIALVSRSGAGVGRAVGNAYAANTAGTIAGSAAAGLALIPLLGTQKTLLLAAGVNLLAAATLLTYLLDRRPIRAFAGLFLCALAAVVTIKAGAFKQWDQYLQQAAPYLYAEKYDKYFANDVKGELNALREAARSGRLDPETLRTGAAKILMDLGDEDHPLYGNRLDIAVKLDAAVEHARQGRSADLIAALDALDKEFTLDRSSEIQPYLSKLSEIIHREEGPDLLAAVRKDLWGDLSLTINGKVDASTRGDMRTQVFFGHVGSIYRPDAKSALVIGIGSGVTLGSVALHEGITRIDGVEISPSVLRCLPFFSAFNNDVMRNPRVKIHVEDARSFVAFTGRKYDIINSIPSNPWMAGVSQLFTEEFFRDCKNRLNDGGVMLQWLQRYCLTEEDFKLVLRTFRRVFPSVHVWTGSLRADYLLVGSNEPPNLAYENVKRLFAGEAVRADLARVNLRTPAAASSLFVMGTGNIEKYAGAGPVNTDDLNFLEFHAPRHLFAVKDSTFINIAAWRENPAGYLFSRVADRENPPNKMSVYDPEYSEITRAFEMKTLTINAIYTIIRGNETADAEMIRDGTALVRAVLEDYPDEEMAIEFIDRYDFQSGLSSADGAWNTLDRLVSYKLPDNSAELDGQVKKMLEYAERARMDFSDILARNPLDRRAAIEYENVMNMGRTGEALSRRACAELKLDIAGSAIRGDDAPPDKAKAKRLIGEARDLLKAAAELVDGVIDNKDGNVERREGAKAALTEKVNIYSALLRAGNLESLLEEVR